MNYAIPTTTHIYNKSTGKQLVNSLFNGPRLVKQNNLTGTSNLWYTIYANTCLVSRYARPVRFTSEEQMTIRDAFTPGACIFDTYGCWVGFARDRN